MSETQPFDPRSYHAQFDIAMIVACSQNGVIGSDGDLPWHLPDDLRHFMRSTKGCPVIMGRKTFDSLEKPLPNRLNIILSRSMDDPGCPDVQIARDLDASIEIAKAAICENGQDGPVWIAGGGTIYRQGMDRTDLIVRTFVETTLEGDTFFPDLDPQIWELHHSAHTPADTRHLYGFRIEWWVRKQG